MYAIAVTNPAGWTRYIGRLVWWADELERALTFDSAADAEAHISNPHTLAGERKRAGWRVHVTPVR